MVEYIVSGAIFLITLLLIIAEQFNRTTAALIGALAMVMAGKYLGFYDEKAAWEALDYQTLLLLLGMMVLVNILRSSGFFQYLAVKLAKLSGGNPKKLLWLLGGLIFGVSMFLNNVTSVLLLAPLTILIAEMLGLNPLPLLMAEALLANLGGVATLVGDPPNIMIASVSGFSFNDFLIYLAPIAVLCLFITIWLIDWVYRRELSKQPQNLEELEEMDENAAVKNPKIMKRTLIVMGIVILLFFLSRFFPFSPAFVTLLGVALAFLWVKPDISQALEKSEWEVLFFFAGLFVVVGGMEHSGLLGLLAKSLGQLAGGNLLAASLILLWAAALLSAVVDNIPFTIAMIPVIQNLGELGINVAPLWWALALGAGLGGNGSPIGASPNIIVMALSEKTRHPITFKTWLRSGTLVTLATCLASSLIFILLFRFMH